MSFETRKRRDPAPDAVNTVVVLLASVVMAAAGIAFVVMLARGDQVVGVGTALAVGLTAGAVAVRRAGTAIYPRIEAVEDREIGEDASSRTPATRSRGRRRLLTALLGGSSLVVLASLLTPLRSLGPSAAGQLGTTTPWGPGVRLTDGDGNPVRVEDVPPGGIGTVWPDGDDRTDTAAVILVRLSAAPSPPTNPEWVVDEALVAYSKTCTHMGCPVGLFEEGIGSLFCPCHQARFDAGSGARPVFGPPARALPQLPLGTDDEGYLIALDDFVEPVGPTTGRRT